MKSQALRHLAVFILLTGCTIGPDFKIPSPPDVQSLTPRPLKARVVADGKVQWFVHGLDMAASAATVEGSRSDGAAGRQTGGGHRVAFCARDKPDYHVHNHPQAGTRPKG